MRVVLIVVGVLMVLMGGVWLFQGIGILLGSPMTSQPFWAIVGSIVVVLGVVVAVVGIRRAPAKP